MACCPLARSRPLTDDGTFRKAQTRCIVQLNIKILIKDTVLLNDRVAENVDSDPHDFNAKYAYCCTAVLPLHQLCLL